MDRDGYKTKRDLLHLLKRLGIKSSAERGTLLREDLEMAMEAMKAGYGVPSQVFANPAQIESFSEVLKSIKFP